MTSRLYSVLICALICCVSLAQEPLALQPYSYHESFEGDAPTLGLWAKNGPSTVNFSGPTDEMAFDGTRSLKLDVSLEGGSYHYFGVPVRVPAAGNLKLTARVLVAPGTTARVGFGTNMNYPPTHHSGCGPDQSWDKPTDGWQLVEIDLVEKGISGKTAVIARHTATTSGEDVGAYLDRWSLFILGGEGERAVVYVDDVRIEGEVPSEADYDRQVAQRWEQAKERFSALIVNWRGRLAEAAKAVDSLPAVPEEMAPKVQAIRDEVARGGKLIDDVAARGYCSREELDSIEAAIRVLRHGPETVAAMIRGLEANQPYLLYAPRPITNERLVAQVFPIPARPATDLSCSGCPGEFESLSIAVQAIKPVEGLTLAVSDLTGPGGAIPAANVDIYAVKVWYQAGWGIADLKNKTLAPELLLKDSDLVRVDREAETNFLRSTNEDGTEEYLLCSDSANSELDRVRPVDADTLRPVNLDADDLQQFWLRIQIPADAAAGVYTGQVSVKSGDGEQAIPLSVTVHPFELAPSRLIYSIYYRGRLSPDGEPTIGSELKSEEQYLAEIKDMRDHGVLYPTNYQGWDEDLLPRVLELREEAGLPTEHFFNLGLGTGNSADPARLAALAGDVRKWLDQCRRFGYGDIYFYGIDEATGDRLASQRAAWKTVQEAGGKTFVAGYKKTFEAMGALLNCAVLAGKPDIEERDKWHSVGSLVFTYAYPQVGNEEPETYRRNFGLALWKAGFDGAMDYAYQHGFGHVWNDFDSPHYRDHNFTYPTVSGVIGTVQWEGFREGVDDVRYATTLELAIQNAPADKADLARQAREWLDTVDPSGDLDAIRAGMVEWIGKLN